MVGSTLDFNIWLEINKTMLIKYNYKKIYIINFSFVV